MVFRISFSTILVALLLMGLVPAGLAFSVSSSVAFSSPRRSTLCRFCPRSKHLEVPHRLYSSSSSSDNSRYLTTTRRAQRDHRDVVIVGGGLAGLSVALYLSQLDPSRHVTILEREEAHSKITAVGSFAAAGMLAPQSERLPKGSLLDLCLSSRRMFPEFVDLVESLAQESGSEGSKYLYKNNDNNNDNLKPWSTGYVASGGFLAPAFAGDSVATWAAPSESGSATWLDAIQVRELEPQLHPSVVGGWWFPEDASVDARRLTCSLRAACVAAGVQLLCGPDYEITSLDLSDATCRGLWIQNGRYMSAKSIVVANGAWMRNLLPVPIEPHKGQSLSLRMPPNQPPILRRVLFAQDSYIVPKADGRIVIGATVEAGSYDPNVTPAGILHILTHALQLVPGLKDLPLEETWAGLRPTTPDKGPILGNTRWDNLYLAGGYWRNGVLLAPKTGQLLASLISGQQLSTEDQQLLDAFRWDRFTLPGKGAALAAQSRYAASVYPLQSRSLGVGVAASVGTELGVYSSARSAAQERQRDRNSLFQQQGDQNKSNGNDLEKAFERAATLGKQDSAAYSFGGHEATTLKEDVVSSESLTLPVESDGDDSLQVTEPYEGSADALTVGSATSSTNSNINREVTRTNGELPSVSSSSSSGGGGGGGGGESQKSLEDVYQSIRANKARQVVELDDSHTEEARPDPGFRIYHKDESGQTHEVPPYTTPGDFLASLQQQRQRPQQQQKPGTVPGDKDDCGASGVALNGASAQSLENQSPSPTVPSTSTYNEQTFDGYQDIQHANSRSTRQEELQAMKEARQRNRQGQSSIDPSQIGAQRSQQQQEDER